MNLPVFSKASAVPTRNPRANRFRVGDTWRGPEGRTYSVMQSPDEGLVILHPIGWNMPIRLKETAVQGFSRLRWGGMD